ncbi:MAG: hypothetical protein KDD44_12335, partial [Bdellovibrionales bacterium]|nr:hypothetical protein [Bdellovibrionales bacterium]
KVTPSSKVVGDLALFLVANNLTGEDFVDRADKLDLPGSVYEFFRGEIGTPFGGFPEELRNKVLRGKPHLEGRPGESLEATDLEAARREVTELLHREASPRDVLSYVLYPAVYRGYAEARRKFSDLSLLPTPCYFYGMQEGEEIFVDIERGKRLFIQLVAVSEPGEHGERTVFFELNGQPRNISVRDAAVAPDSVGNEPAEEGNPQHVGAPLAGAVVELNVSVGDVVTEGMKLFVLEAMKMQSVVTAAVGGTVARVLFDVGAKVGQGDLVVELE